MQIKNIENRLERTDARIKKSEKMEAQRKNRKALASKIKSTLDIITISFTS